MGKDESFTAAGGRKAAKREPGMLHLAGHTSEHIRVPGAQRKQRFTRQRFGWPSEGFVD